MLKDKLKGKYSILRNSWLIELNWVMVGDLIYLIWKVVEKLTSRRIQKVGIISTKILQPIRASHKSKIKMMALLIQFLNTKIKVYVQILIRLWKLIAYLIRTRLKIKLMLGIIRVRKKKNKTWIMNRWVRNMLPLHPIFHQQLMYSSKLRMAIAIIKMIRRIIHRISKQVAELLW